MNVTVTDQPHCKKLLRLEIPADAVRAETEKVVSELARRIKIPGFRPGRVPKSVIKTRFRKELRDEVVSQLLPHALGDAIRDKELKVVGKPELDDLKFGSDESIDATFTVEVAPDFTLSEYKGLTLKKVVYKARDEDVDKAINRLREQQAEMVPVEDRGAAIGDVVTVNLRGHFENAGGAEPTDEGRGGTPPPEAINDPDTEIHLTESTLSEFRDALIGARAGDRREFTARYAGDFPGERVAGRVVNYLADVTAVRAKELPELDDEFAESVGSRFRTLEQLRATVRSELEQQAAERTTEELRSAAMRALVDRNRFEVPEYIVEKRVDLRMKASYRQMAARGIDPRKLKLDWEALRESHRDRAQEEVRAGFILDRIAELEKIEVAAGELDRELERVAGDNNIAALKARLTKENALDSIKEQVRNRKALELVVSSAEVRIEEVEGLDRKDEASGGEGGQAGEGTVS